MEFLVDTQLLRAVMAIARCGSISGAAHALEVSQSAVTKQLRRLEMQLGVTLFERRARGVEPTLFGRVLIERGHLVARQFEDILTEIRALQGGAAGRVVVGAGPTWLHGPLPRALTTLVKERPNVEVLVRSESPEILIEGLRAGEIDFVLAPWMEGLDRNGVTWTPVLVDDLRITAREGHPLLAQPPTSLEELAPYGWVMPERDNPTCKRLIAAFENEGLRPPTPTVETGSFTLLINLVRSTDLLTVLPHLRFDWLTRGLRPIEAPTLRWRRSSGFYQRETAALGPAARILLDDIMAICRDYYGDDGKAIAPAIQDKQKEKGGDAI